MITPSDSLDHPAAPLVPPRVDRARRIARLVHMHPVFAVGLVYVSLDPALRLLGWGPRAKTIGLVTCAVAALLVTLARRSGRFARLGSRRPRPNPRFQGDRGMITMILLFLAVLIGYYFLQPIFEEPGTPLVAVLFLAILAGPAWWWRYSPWPPRLWLVVAVAIGCVLVLLWLPAPGKRMDAVFLVWVGSCFLMFVIDECELYKLLGEADREAEGEPFDQLEPGNA